MANGLEVALSAMTFQFADLQRSDLSLHLDIVEGLNNGLDVRGKDTVIPSAAGQTPRTRKADVRHILLAGILQGTGATEATRLASWQNLRDEVEALFDVVAMPGTLRGMARDGTWRTITARTTSIIWNPAPVLGVDELAIALDSTDPDWEITGGGS